MLQRHDVSQKRSGDRQSYPRLGWEVILAVSSRADGKRTRSQIISGKRLGMSAAKLSRCGSSSSVNTVTALSRAERF